MKNKVICIALILCLLVSTLAVGTVTSVTASTGEAETQYAQNSIQGGAVLHCFNWSYNNIKSNLASIKAAGYTAVQTSPVQAPKNYSASNTDVGGQWWKMYQPLGFTVADGNTWLGTRAQLQSLCEEAEEYGIKVIVDVVANHLANNGTDGGTYEYINTEVESDMKNPDYYHKNNIKFNENSRFNLTQYHMGMPDLNTGHTYVQNKVLNFLKDCVDLGVDGFRFDAAKHIELPTDGASFASDFWPNVVNGIKDYSDDVFIYGEILGGAGTNIIFNNGSSEQTVDIAHDSSVTGYCPTEKNTSGKWKVETFTEEPDADENIYTDSNGKEIDLGETISREADDTELKGIKNEFKNLQILGVQKKKNTEEHDIRFVTVINNEIIKDADDYGYIAVSAEGMENARSVAESFTLEKAPEKHIFSCKGTSNKISGNYGKREADTKYKYVTYAVNDIGDNAVAVMFFIQDQNGKVFYAPYTNSVGTTFNSCSADWNALNV